MTFLRLRAGKSAFLRMLKRLSGEVPCPMLTSKNSGSNYSVALPSLTNVGSFSLLHYKIIYSFAYLTFIIFLDPESAKKPSLSSACAWSLTMYTSGLISPVLFLSVLITTVKKLEIG